MTRQGAVETALRSFLSDKQEEIIAAWKVAVGPDGSAELPGNTLLPKHAPQVLNQVAVLAGQLARGQPLHAVLDRARAGARVLIDEPADLPRLLAELSALRASATRVWLRAPGAGVEDPELRAVDAAVDVLIAAGSSRADVPADRVGRTAWERDPALDELESLLAASPVGIAFLDRDLRYLRINEALAAMNGRPAAAHVGQSIFEMLPGAADALEPMLRQVIETGQPVLNGELTAGAPTGGEPRMYLATFFPVRAGSGEIIGVGGVVSDITEAKRVEEDLRRVQERMQLILEHTQASIWVKDAGGRVVLANHRLADAVGHPYEEVMGRRSEDLLPADVARQHRTHDEIVTRENRAIEVEEVVPHPDGTRTFLSIKFPLPGDPPMVGGIATDITDRKRMEEELRVAVRMRETVLTTVSHDLRNPLSTIQFASAALLGQFAEDLRGRRHLEIIHRSCLRMEHLIADLLDMSSIGAGRLSIETRPERAEDILRETFELHQTLAGEKKVAFTLRPLDDDAEVECDRQRILQVFENLIGNALKFCRVGDTVAVGGERVEGAVRFWVEDTGPGIPPELIAHLFDPYWSGPETRHGVGLGLYIARGIVERHGGRLDVQSTVRQGSRFSFTIPVVDAPAGSDTAPARRS